MKQSIHDSIEKLLYYGLHKSLFCAEDIEYVHNRILHLLDLEKAENVQPHLNKDETIAEILEPILDWATRRGLIEANTVTYRDLFDTALMDLLLPRPSEVNQTFFQHLADAGPERATAAFYQFNQDANYIRSDRMLLNESWNVQTAQYGSLEITINLSKPEIDPVVLAAERKAKKEQVYPNGPLVKQNVGFAGHLRHPARQNLRILPVTLAEESWYMQFSPYVYYHQHAIVFSGEQRPMAITPNTFKRLFEFVDQYPHYFIGSNADLPIVGGSILEHDHYQGGVHSFPMAKAPLKQVYKHPHYPAVEIGTVKWPMSVIRLTGANQDHLHTLATTILRKWKAYSDPDLHLLATTDGERHNTITPVARRVKQDYQIDLVLRNNRTTSEHPLGLFHPHEDVHCIKKENIGLIEVMGLAILPGRLKAELQELADILPYASAEERLLSSESVSKHANWARSLKQRTAITAENVDACLREEVGRLFNRVLEHSGVFKDTAKGDAGFTRFLHACFESN